MIQYLLAPLQEYLSESLKLTAYPALTR